MNSDTQSNALASTGAISLINPTGFTLFPTSLPVNPVVLPVDNLRSPTQQSYASVYDSAPFSVIASGTITPSRSDSSVVLGLYSGQYGSNNQFNLWTSSSISVPALTRNFYLRFDMIWDSSSSTLNGNISTGFVAGTQVSLAALATSTFNNLSSFVFGASLSTANSVPSAVVLSVFHLNIQ